MLNVVSANVNGVSFKSKPPVNYKKIDKFVSRSAQPNEDNLKWLRDEGVSDIINFRTMYVPALDFSEEEAVKKLGMKYHNIPTTENNLNKRVDMDDKISKFFDIVDNARAENKKVHIHCKAGADRTGFFALLYKARHDINTFEYNAQEMLDLGHHQKRYPNVIEFAREIIKKFKKK